MQKMFRLLLISCFLSTPLLAQSTDTKLDEIPIQKRLLPYVNPLGVQELSEPIAVRPTLKPDELQKDLLRRISDAYRIHVLSVDAQVMQDLISAEQYINDSFAAIQSLMDDFPEIQNNRRFVELYRSVMTEYREFYGVTDPIIDVEGEIFAIQRELYSDEDNWMVEGYNLPDNLTFNKTEVPLVQNEHVSRHLMYYTLRRPDVMERWLERSEFYFPMMEQIFKEEGAPRELIHLSMIESGLVPTARSWAAAVGLWQFIRATGAVYGLEVNWWVDERRDPEKSTRAAARHLVDLYNIWGDWHLALANYNISPRGLRRAINAAGGKEDYWTAFPFLPRETRGYVPGFIAATMIAMNPQQFGFQPVPTGVVYSYDVANVEGLMPLDLLAKAAGLTVQQLKDYNPELLRWATPPGDSYPLKLPKGSVPEFMIAYNEIPKDARSQEIAMHTVSRGETLGAIASRYGTTVRALYESNDNLSNIIHPGQTIIVPVAPGSMNRIAANTPSNQPGSTANRTTTTTTTQTTQVQAPPNHTLLRYTVKSGDTIGHIAEWYDVRSWQIRGWNGINNTIRVGQRLNIYVPNNRLDYYRQVDQLTFAQKQELERLQRDGVDIYSRRFASANTSSAGETVNYTVRRNDTLINIAQSFGVTVNDIQRLNNLNGTTIYAGQTLRIR